MTINEVFEKNIYDRIAGDLASAKKIGGVIQCDAITSGQSWVIDLTKESNWVSKGPSPAAMVKFAMTDEDWVAMIGGEFKSMEAFMTGKLQIDGDFGFATRVQKLFP